MILKMDTKLQNNNNNRSNNNKVRPNNINPSGCNNNNNNNNSNNNNNNHSNNNNRNGSVICLYSINNYDFYNNADNYGDHQFNIPHCSSNTSTINEFVDANLTNKLIKVPYLYTTTTTTEKIVNNRNNNNHYRNNNNNNNNNNNGSNNNNQKKKKLTSCNRRNRVEWHHNQRRYRNNNNNNNNNGRSFDEYDESDESCSSYSSRDTPDDNLFQNHEDYSDNNNNNKSLVIFTTPNLYQPITELNKNKLSSIMSYQCTNNYNNNSSRNQSKSNKNSDIIIRRAHGLMERFKSRGQKLRVHLNPIDLIIGHTAIDELNQSIWEIFVNNIQNDETYIRKLNLWKQIFLYIRKFLNSYGLFLVGSTMSGFALEGSDIDMCLLTKPFSNDPRIDSLHHLSYLKQLLTNDGIANHAELIMAKVPILKFRNDQTGFEVDLNCNNGVGIQNTQLLYTYAQLDWRVRPLVTIVKLWAQANNINNAKNMTISSYSWALMVIHYLQCGMTPPVLPCLHEKIPSKFNTNQLQQYDIQDDIELMNTYKSDNKKCLGDLLIGFFQYYSIFDYTKYVISVRTAKLLLIDDCRYVKTPKNDPNQWKCLCIEEPFNLSNTARSVFDPDIFENIKNIILQTYEILSKTKMLNYIFQLNLKR